MKDLPLVSIITPSYNQGQFIEDTILSVKNQDYLNIEHIIVDGGSTDDTLGILKKYESTYNMRWISEPDEGQSDAINKGFEMMNGEISAWLNSDDIYFSNDVVSYIVEEFCRFSKIDIIFGNDTLIDKDNRILEIRRMPEFNYERLLRCNVISQPATFFKSKVIRTCKLDENLDCVMDLELWLRLSKNGYNFKHVDKILAGNRIHKNRKMIARKYEASNEAKKVRKKYGNTYGLKHYLFSYLVDRLNLHVRRIQAIIDIFDIHKNKYKFPVNIIIDSRLCSIKNQIFAKG